MKKEQRFGAVSVLILAGFLTAGVVVPVLINVSFLCCRPFGN